VRVAEQTEAAAANVADLRGFTRDRAES
jgi:hypothetical protein